MLEAALWGSLTGSALILGGAVAVFLRPRPLVVGLVLAFGGGALISAVVYELLGEAVVDEGVRGVAFYIFAGALAFTVGDWLIEQLSGKDIAPGDEVVDGRGLAIVLGKVLDGAPESFVLGISLVGGASSTAYIVALIVSNVPMAIGATTSLTAAGWQRSHVFLMWVGIAALSAGCAALGYAMFDARPSLTGHRAEAFAAGAILAMLTNTLMPEAYRQGGARAGMFTAFGFVFAVSLSIAD